MLSGGTDAKAFARLGIRCFGFSPLRLPPELDFAALFHGVDERVPVDALKFGTRGSRTFPDALLSQRSKGGLDHAFHRTTPTTFCRSCRRSR